MKLELKQANKWIIISFKKPGDLSPKGYLIEQECSQIQVENEAGNKKKLSKVYFFMSSDCESGGWGSSFSYG